MNANSYLLHGTPFFLNKNMIQLIQALNSSMAKIALLEATFPKLDPRNQRISEHKYFPESHYLLKAFLFIPAKHNIDMYELIIVLASTRRSFEVGKSIVKNVCNKMTIS